MSCSSQNCAETEPRIKHGRASILNISVRSHYPGPVCMRAKWRIKPELIIPVSVAGID